MRPNLNHFTRPSRPPVLGDIGQQLRELPSDAAPPYDFAEFRRRSRERSAPKRQVVTWPYAAAAAGLTAFVAAMALLGTSGGPGPDERDTPAAGGATTAALAGGETSGPATAAVAGGGETSVPPAVAGAGSKTSGPRSAAVEDDKTSAPAGAGGAASNSGPSLVAGAPTDDAGAAPSDDPLERARAARLWLARQPAEPALVRAGPRLAVASLEDRIAWFDDALTDQRLHGASPAQLKVLQQERARLVSSLAQVRYAEALVAGGS